MNNQATFCRYPRSNHRAITMNSSLTCFEHEQVYVEPLFFEQNLDKANDDWIAFEHVFGQNGIENWGDAILLAAKIVRSEYENATRVASYRWFNTFNVQDVNQRNTLAWDLYNGISLGLFPTVLEDVSIAKLAIQEQHDLWGRSLESSQKLISFAITTIFKMAHHAGVQKALDEKVRNNIYAYLEFVGNYHEKNTIKRVFGEKIYDYQNVILQTTHQYPVSNVPFPDYLVIIPEQVRVAQENSHRIAVEQAQKQNEQLKVAGKVAVGLLGSGLKAVGDRSRRIEQKQRDREDAEYRKNVHYNAEVWAKRNRRSKDAGWF